jgi:hypothetical protein
VRILRKCLLNQYADIIGSESPVGQGTRVEQSLRVLPDGTTKTFLYEENKNAWMNALPALQELVDIAKKPTTKPLSKSTFLTYWTYELPNAAIWE